MSRFYVYRHIRADTGEVFYVGKGCFRKNRKETFERANADHSRNKFWAAIVKRAGGFESEIVMMLDTDMKAGS